MPTPVPGQEGVPPPPELSEQLPPGTRVGEYAIEGPLGSGAFGAVYAATHPVIDKPAAVKVLAWRYSSDPEMVTRFIDEARAVNQIQHPNIIDIFNFGRLPNGQRYHVMERLFGEGLDTVLAREGKLEPERVAELMRPIAGAVKAAHDVGVIHRDIKPANVYVCEDGEPKLLDFGVAKLIHRRSAHRSATGVAVGTPAYMSPEQCLGEKMGPTVDIYALGVLAFKLLSGRLPYEAESSFEVMSAHVNDPVPSLHRIDGRFSPAVSAALKSMMAKEPEDRPQSPIEAVETLCEALLSGGRSAARPWPLIAAGAVAAVGALTWALWPGEPTADPAGATQVAPTEVTTTDPAVTPASGDVSTPVEKPVETVAEVPVREPVETPTERVVEPGPEAAPDTRPEPAVEPPKPQPIQLTFTDLPKDAQITWNGEAHLLDESGALAVPQGEEEIRLVISAPGHKPRSLKVVPKADATLDGTLKRIVIKRGRRRSGSRGGAAGDIHSIDPW